MTRKSAVLSSSLVAVKGVAAPSADMPGRASPTAPVELPQSDLPSKDAALGTPLNFRVPENFRREFKVYAAQHGLKLNELLQRSFKAYRDRNSS